MLTYVVMCQPQHNNSFNASGIRLILKFDVDSRRVNSSVMSPLRVKMKKLPAAPQLNAAWLVWIIERLVEEERRLYQPIRQAHGMEHQLSRSRLKINRRSARRNRELQHNNSFDRSASQPVFRSTAWMLVSLCARSVNSGVRWLLNPIEVIIRTGRLLDELQSTHT
jgi:hypothetical protein